MSKQTAEFILEWVMDEYSVDRAEARQIVRGMVNFLRDVHDPDQCELCEDNG